jgi:hypothetical protein
MSDLSVWTVVDVSERGEVGSEWVPYGHADALLSRVKELATFATEEREKLLASQREVLRLTDELAKQRKLASEFDCPMCDSNDEDLAEFHEWLNQR